MPRSEPVLIDDPYTRFNLTPNIVNRIARLSIALLTLAFLLPSCAIAHAEEASDLVFIDNGVLRLGVKKSSGGAIAWLSRSGSKENLVNHFDRGRLIQQSYYGAEDDSLWNKTPWRWNPVQGGDWRGKGAMVLDYYVQDASLYTRTLPKHWARGNDLPECSMQQWIRLDDEMAHLRYRFTYRGKERHPARDQELPAIFLEPQYDTLVLYQGDKPWDGEEPTRLRPGWPNEYHPLPERWAAYVNDQGEGLGAFVPAAERLTCYRFGDGERERGACSYFAPLATFAIEPGLVFEYDVFLTLGKVDDIRRRFATLRETLRDGKLVPHEPFDPDSRLAAYLKDEPAATIHEATLNLDTVRLTGHAPREGAFFVAEYPLHASVGETLHPVTITPITPDAHGAFSLSLERIVTAEGATRDRLLSRWAVVQKPDVADQDGPYRLVSHLRYADVAPPTTEVEPHKLRGRKGLGALWLGRPYEDLDELQIAAVTVNIRLDTILRADPGAGREPFVYQGKTWYFDRSSVNRLDQVLAEAARRNILVSAILLIPRPGQGADPGTAALLAHPDAHTEGTYAMPNLCESRGIEAYGAVIDFLARRYGPQNPEGRIHHWIMHNEVDAGWQWTNAGEKSALRYLDLYHRSMRLVHQIARQYDPHAKTFISLTHHWATTSHPRFYPGRDLLERLLDFSRCEGDFDWGIAYHPYPQDLGNPRTWEDTEATFTFDTPKITFRNLEVLDSWVKQPRTFYQHKHRRTVHLTEQGLNARNYRRRSLEEQAAGMAYAWQKMKALDSIEVFHYHNWVDHPDEGGLRIGLRRFPNDPQDPSGKKPIWHVFRALDTPEEEAALRFALPIVGVKDWSEVVHREPIVPSPP